MKKHVLKMNVAEMRMLRCYRVRSECINNKLEVVSIEDNVRTG